MGEVVPALTSPTLHPIPSYCASIVVTSTVRVNVVRELSSFILHHLFRVHPLAVRPYGCSSRECTCLEFTSLVEHGYEWYISERNNKKVSACSDQITNQNAM